MAFVDLALDEDVLEAGERLLFVEEGNIEWVIMYFITCQKQMNESRCCREAFLTFLAPPHPYQDFTYNHLANG